MTPDPLVIAPGSSLDQALELMDGHRIRHLPVVEDGRVAGVISDRDLLSATGWMPARRPEGDAAEGPRLVREVAHSPAVTIAPDETVVSAAIEMIGRGIGCLPVVNSTLVGILTETDMLRAFLHIVREGGLEGEVNPLVERHMVHDVVSVTEEATLGEVETLLRSIDSRHLLVVRGASLSGIVSDRDVRRARGLGAGDDAQVDEVMTERVWTVEPMARLTDAARGMLDHRVSALPVVDWGRLVGILTLTDLLDHCLEVLRDRE
jgi:acetoin utilization protein AcuB